MEDIAAEAGMNRALLHYYFRKEKMFDMIFEENLQLFIREFLAVLQQDVPFKDKIAMLGLGIDTLLEHPEILFSLCRDRPQTGTMAGWAQRPSRIHRHGEFGRQLTERRTAAYQKGRSVGRSSCRSDGHALPLQQTHAKSESCSRKTPSSFA